MENWICGSVGNEEGREPEPPRLLAYTVNNASPFQFQQQHRKRESIFTKLEAVMVINHFSFFFLKKTGTQKEKPGPDISNL